MSDEEEAPAWYQEIVKERDAPLGMAQRVRIDVGECPHFLTWHGTIEQNVTGIVISNEATGGPPGHTYTVWFDRPIRARQSWDYARHELTPVPWPTPEEIVAETRNDIDTVRLLRSKESIEPFEDYKKRI